MYSKILVPVDGSTGAANALRMAVDLAKKYGSSLTVMHVVARRVYAFPVHGVGPLTATLMEEMEEEGKEVLQKAGKIVTDAGLELNTRIAHGVPAEEILKEAEKERYDLIVIGSRGLSEVKAFFLGSVSDKVSHHSTCSVLIVKEPR